MNQVQTNYVKAKAAYEQALKLKNAEVPRLPADITEEELDAFIDLEVAACAKYRVNEKLDAMLDARDALFEWAKAVVSEQMAGNPQLDEALSVFDRCRFLPSIMGQVVDLTLRLEA